MRLRAATTVVLLSAAFASAQDAEPIAEAHPLREMLTETMRQQQVRAAQRMVDATRALKHAQTVAYVDTNDDGVGELPALAEALGLVRWRGSDDPPAGVLGWGEAVLHDDGVVEASGYLYRVVLPDAALGEAASLDEVDANHAAHEAIVYAWPVRYGISGKWTFGAHVRRGQLLATRAESYSGRDAPPAFDALLAPRGTTGDTSRIDEPLLERGRGRDGNAWGAARDFVPQLWEDEPDLGLEELESDTHWAAELARLRTPAWEAVCGRGGLAHEHPYVAARTLPVARVATPQQIAKAIADELRYPMERTGQWERQKASFQLVGATTPAKYVASENVILVCPETLAIVCAVAEIDASRIEDVMQVLLLHESVHAFQFQTYPLQEALRQCRSEAAIAAWSAVTEGHAQQVTRRVTAGRKLEPAFRDMLKLNAPPSDADAGIPGDARAALASQAFPYHDGELFMDAVLAARGDEGVAAVLRAPPTRPMLIETPELYLARPADAPETPWPVIMAPLVALEAPGSDVRRSPVLRSSMRQMLAAAPQLNADVVVDGLVDVESRVTVAPGGRSQTATTVLLCRDAQAARNYVIASRALQSSQDAAYESNPLVEPEVTYAPPPDIDGITAGYRVRKILRSAGGEVHGTAVSVAAGRWVVETAITRLEAPSPEAERELIRAVEAALGAATGR